METITSKVRRLRDCILSKAAYAAFGYAMMSLRIKKILAL